MIIAFEGPDKTGKSTSAGTLDHSGDGRYNMTTESYKMAKQLHQQDKGLVSAFDRIDWLTHMTYRLALPGYEWHDARIRTVFAAPDTHLVFKLHHHGLTDDVQDELYEPGVLATVNNMYHYMAQMFTALNEARDWAMFKTITTMEVINDTKCGGFAQRITDYSSPVNRWGTVAQRLVSDEATLLEFLQCEDQHRD